MTETMLRGSKIRIFPNKRQKGLLDLWRRRTISLWNLLLSLEQAAYSGDNTRSKLGWRSIWAQVVEERHANAVTTYHEGKRRRDGSFRKEPGVGREDERAELKKRLDELKKQKLTSTEAFNEAKKSLRKIARKPLSLDPEVLSKIRREATEVEVTVNLDSDELEVSAEKQAAKLFMWKEEMQAIMARLKRVPRTQWIADLPSHAAQKVVESLILALEAMLRERKKRASGAGGRDTGFPKFKKSRYAAGSIYFANTQIKFDFENQKVKFPNGCGWMNCEVPRHLRASALESGSKVKLMGGRAWRQGERWYLSCQWQLEKPEALKPTGRTAGVKIGASVLLTTYDDRGQTREYTMPEPDKKLEALHRVAAKKLSRSMEAQKKREKKIKNNGYSQRRQQRLASTEKKDKPLRLRRTPGFYQAAARLAGYEAIERDRRDGFLHELTTEIVRKFDAIAVQRFEVATLMEKESTKKKRRLAQIDNAVERNAAAEGTKKQWSKKPVRKLMRRVAMARCGQLLKYKYNDLRGPDAYQDIDKHDVNATACSSCGAVHPEWREARGIVRCHEVLANGDICGNALPRNRNAARLSEHELCTRQKKKRSA